MKIKRASFNQIEEIAALHTASWRNTYGGMLSESYLLNAVPAERLSIWRQRLASPKENQLVLVAEEDEFVVGFACVFIGEHAQWGSYLDNLHVSQAHQGRGVGRSLLAKISSKCELRCPGRGLYLSVNQANQRAQQFYLSLGAHNAQAAVWNAPDGSQVPTFRFAWHQARALCENAAHECLGALGNA